MTPPSPLIMLQKYSWITFLLNWFLKFVPNASNNIFDLLWSQVGWLENDDGNYF